MVVAHHADITGFVKQQAAQGAGAEDRVGGHAREDAQGEVGVTGFECRTRVARKQGQHAQVDRRGQRLEGRHELGHQTRRRGVGHQQAP